MRKRELVKKVEPIISICVKYYSLFSKKQLQKMFNRSKYITGYRGLLRRYCIVKNLAKSCGKNVAIFDNIIMNGIENMEIGDNVAFNAGVYIEAYAGITIGSNVGISHGVSLLSTNHKFDRVDIPHTEQGLEEGKIVIGDDVWIGCKSTVLMGVEIGDGCVVGAGAVVTKSLSPYSVSVGVPAKIIRMRK